MVEPLFYHLVYVSSAVPDLSKKQLKGIVEESCYANALFDITGVLLHLNGNFLQALEGAKDDVLQLYKNILKDKRHINVITLLTEESDHRMFPDWLMYFREIKEDELHMLCRQHSLTKLAHLEESDKNDKVHILLRSFINSNFWR